MEVPRVCRVCAPFMSQEAAKKLRLLAEDFGPLGAVTKAGLTARRRLIEGLLLASVEAIMIG